jgi:serine/threonine-protein kinase
MKRAVAHSLCFVTLVLAPSYVRADDAAPSAMAESLFDQGRALLDAGKTEEACAKFAASKRLEPAPGTSLNLADCYARLGRTATAWVTFVDAAADARREHDDFREHEATTRADALAPKLSRLRVHVISRPQSAHVEIDGAAIPDDVSETSLPVDPGSRRVRVSAEGYVAREIVVTIPSGPSETIATIDPLTPVSKQTPPSPFLEPKTERPFVPFWSGLRVASVVSAGVGVASAGVGIGFGLAAKSKWDDANRVCPTSSCNDPSARSSGQTAGTFADVSTGTFIGAGVLLGAAAVLWIVAPKSTSSQARASLTPNGVALHFE